MGEFMKQMLGEGPPLVDLTDVVGGMIPGLGPDLEAGADPVAACVALARCRPRTIQAPHREYGHLLFGVAIYSPCTKRDDAIRSIADIVGGAHGAPAFGSRLGDVSVSEVAAVFGAHGFTRTAAAWVEAERAHRARLRAEATDVLVWDVPGDHTVRAVAVTSDGRYMQVDFAVYGERLVGCYNLDLPGVSTYVTAFERAFGRGSWESHHASPEGAVRLRAALTAHCGAPRSLRILEIDE